MGRRVDGRNSSSISLSIPSVKSSPDSPIVVGLVMVDVVAFSVVGLGVVVVFVAGLGLSVTVNGIHGGTVTTRCPSFIFCPALNGRPIQIYNSSKM